MSKPGFTNIGWKYQPNGIVGAQMNGYFVAALKLTDDEVFIHQFTEERIKDPALLELTKKSNFYTIRKSTRAARRSVIKCVWKPCAPTARS